MEFQAVWLKVNKPVRTGLLGLAALSALYVSAVLPMRRSRELALQRETGLGATFGQSAFEQSSAERSFSQQSSLEQPSQTVYRSGTLTGMVGGVPGGASLQAIRADSQGSPEADRKLVTTSSLDLVVKDPAAVAEKVRELAIGNGGYLLNSQVNGSADSASASVTIRVPVASFGRLRGEIRKLGLRIEDDKLEAQDVTRNYVDQESRLRNLRAQEQQYLQILKRASTVKDTLEVSDKLNEVRGQIEQQQAEFEALSKQVETVAITVGLRAEAEAQVLGLNWKPLYRLKSAARDGLNGLGDYVASMAGFVFLVPAILLWMLTLVAGAAIAWRILRWLARVFFHFPKAAKAVS